MKLKKFVYFCKAKTNKQVRRKRKKERNSGDEEEKA